MDTPSINTHEQFKKDLEIVLSDIKELLIEKNEKYGDSALNPVKVFSRLDPIEAIKIRLDDKISRVRNNLDGDTEDPVKDLLGYLLLYKIAEKREAERPKYDTEVVKKWLHQDIKIKDITDDARLSHKLGVQELLQR